MRDVVRGQEREISVSAVCNPAKDLERLDKWAAWKGVFPKSNLMPLLRGRRRLGWLNTFPSA